MFLGSGKQARDQGAWTRRPSGGRNRPLLRLLVLFAGTISLNLQGCSGAEVKAEHGPRLAEDAVPYPISGSHDAVAESIDDSRPRVQPPQFRETPDSSIGYYAPSGGDLRSYRGWITFDDGPHPKTTKQLINALQASGVRNAVFFFVGKRLERYPEIAREVVNSGYEIGYHSMDHANQVGMSGSQVSRDIAHFKKTLDRALGRPYPLRYARPPFGGMTRSTARILQGLEQTGELAGKPVRANVRGSLVNDLVAPEIEVAYQQHGLEIWLWNVDFDDWEQPIDPRHATAQYRPNVEQVWLFHELPTYKGKTYDNRVQVDLPKFLAQLGALRQQSGGGVDPIWGVHRSSRDWGLR